MLKKYSNKLVLFLGGLVLAGTSHIAAATDCKYTFTPTKLPDISSYSHRFSIDYIANDRSKCLLVATASYTDGGSYSAYDVDDIIKVQTHGAGGHIEVAPGQNNTAYDRKYTIKLTNNQDSSDKHSFNFIQKAFKNPTVPNNCSDGKTYKSGICYSGCKDGYKSDGLAVCYENCKDGYKTSTIGMCQLDANDGGATYPKYNCKTTTEAYTCKILGIKTKNGCLRTRTNCDDCRAGYADDGLICRKKGDWVYAKKSYTPDSGMPGCPSDKYRFQELCYDK